MKLPENLVLGYAALAKLLRTTQGALSTARNRGNLPVEPVGHIGMTLVFDRKQVDDYIKQHRDAKVQRR